ncbi:TonB-dependent receptor [Neolewinella aurantiaca]|uniref:TonB-dependent receptor n=1 Tax=Neolewinella aurantiaca TaxID=2602767 RepID=A0A5C7F4J5_9BACT|nr:TonB-dependent receptor plug domain-containing protein [Neolewinella aurantiaca]TXF83353.1 TonB-dependent receptor [Neolewinella aurantiaca]
MYKCLKSAAFTLGGDLFQQASFLLFLSFCSSLSAQDYRKINGFVIERATGEPIIGAQLIPVTGDGATTTNVEGYFQTLIDAPALIVQAFGYASDTLVLSKWENSGTFGMSSYTFSTIEVRTNKADVIRAPGSIQPKLEDLRNLPSLLGEPDLLRSITIYPGVSNGVEGTTGLHVQGGSPDQNLMLLDGGTIYNSGHVFGFLSVFNPDIVSSAELYKGYIPPSFSGRLSSVLDVTTKSGQLDQASYHASFGLVNSSFSAQGPTGALKRGSFIFGIRAAHSFPLTALAGIFSAEENEVKLLAGMYDVNAKYTLRGKQGTQLALSLYSGSDLLRTKDENDNATSVFRLAYGNQIASAKYTVPLSISWFARTNVSFSNYRSELLLRSTLEDGGTNELSSIGSVGEFKLRQDFSTTNRLGTIRLGVLGSARNSTPLRLEGDDLGEEIAEPTASFKNTKISLYAESVSTVGKFTLSGGVNLNRYYLNGSDFKYNGIEPRAGLTFAATPKLRFSFGFSKALQDLHYLQGIGASLPYDVWLPVTEDTPAEESENYTANTTMNGKHFDLTLGGFYRRMNQLVTSRNAGFSVFNGNPNDYEDQLSNEGRGSAYGVELFFEHKKRDNKFSLSYTWMRSLREFSEINGGTQFPYRFDRPHDLQITLQRKLSEKWSLSSSFTLQSGARFTTPTGYVIGITGEPVPVFQKRNNSRLPIYHRLDVMFSRHFSTAKGKIARLDLGLYNAYSRANTSFATIRQEFYREDFFGPIDGQSIFFLKGSVLRIIPTINYSLKW